MEIDKRFFITYPPVQCSKEHYKVFNEAILQALSDIMTNGDVSRMRELDDLDIGAMLKPAFRDFYNETIKWFKQNKDLLPVIRNHKDVLLFFVKGKGRKLIDNLHKEGKIINWPVLASAISEPSFDFSNSNAYEYFVSEANRLNTKYAKSDDKNY
ncbi:MAG: hypothetical protein J6Q51_03775 [Clostridia bacterium]|nr:hypothetical protein [Clostridia bacterium]